MGKERRHKAVKKTLLWFNACYNLSPPYHIVTDPLFLKTSLDNKVFLYDLLPKLLGDKIGLYVTNCVVGALNRLGEPYKSAKVMAKRLQHIQCGHTPLLSPTECLKNIFDISKTRHYIAAVQDPELRSELRQTPGVPIILIYENVLVVEPPSYHSKLYIKRKTEGRLKDNKQKPDETNNTKSKKRKKLDDDSESENSSESENNSESEGDSEKETKEDGTESKGGDTKADTQLEGKATTNKQAKKPVVKKKKRGPSQPPKKKKKVILPKKKEGVKPTRRKRSKKRTTSGTGGDNSAQESSSTPTSIT